jgi:hypothetical protein
VSAEAWVEGLNDAIRKYSESRRTNPVARVTLVTGHTHMLMSAKACAGDRLVALNVYPEPMRGLEDLVRVERPAEEGSEYETPTMLVVPVGAISQIEVLPEPPEQREQLGFHLS